MPMSFPDMGSLKSRAAQRGFRQPNEGETEAQYRECFANYMEYVDHVESIEIRHKHGWDQLPPEILLQSLLRN